MRIAPPVVLDSEQRKTLKQWAGSRSLPMRQVQRAQIIFKMICARWTCRLGNDRDPAHCFNVFRCSLSSTTGGAIRMGKSSSTERRLPAAYWLLIRPHYTRWNADQQCFYHWRERFEHMYIETIKYPTDEMAPWWDIFNVVEELPNPKFEIP